MVGLVFSSFYPYCAFIFLVPLSKYDVLYISIQCIQFLFQTSKFNLSRLGLTYNVILYSSSNNPDFCVVYFIL